MRGGLLALSSVVVVLGLGSAPAIVDDAATCEQGTAAPDEVISACTRLIDSGKLNSKALMNGFNFRVENGCGSVSLTGPFPITTRQSVTIPTPASATTIAEAPITSKAIMIALCKTSIRPCGSILKWLRPTVTEVNCITSRATMIELCKMSISPSGSIPKWAEPYSLRGDLYQAKGDYDRAIQDYDQAVRLDPNNARILNNRGLAKLKKGDTAGANADIAKAKQINPSVGQ